MARAKKARPSTDKQAEEPIPQVSKKVRRKSVYNVSLADEICSRLENGESLRSICRDAEMPDERTVRRWALDTEHPFSPQYARARELGYLKMADEILEIADDGSNDYMTRQNKDGEVEVVNFDHIARSRLRVDTRKWMLSKMLPKIYGEKTEVNVTGDHKHHHTAEPVSASAEWLAGLLGTGADRKGSKLLAH